MLHNPLTTSQRLVSYFFSLFDIQSYYQQQQQQYYDQSPLLSSTHLSSSGYFLNDSIVMVQRRSNKFSYQSDPWSLHTWLKGLSKQILYQLLIDMRPRFVKYGMSTGTAATSTKIASSLSDDSMVSLINNPFHSTSLSAAMTPPSTLTMMKQVLLIQQHARDIVHQLDHLRPSEQFAKASTTAHSLHQLVRLTVDTLRSHSPLALLGMLTIVQELLDASSSELRRHVFYRSKWGRIVILEMGTILKTFTLPSSSHLSASSTATLETINNPSTLQLKRWSSYLIACLNPPTVANEESWMLDWMDLICTSMAKYDRHWKFRHEYHDVIKLAKEYL